MASMVVWAVLRTRAERRRYEDELTAWSAERAAEAERLRIARDLHDIVSHGLGTITVRAAVARRSDGAAATPNVSAPSPTSSGRAARRRPSCAGC
jgi:signal transduction histidine kinase